MPPGEPAHGQLTQPRPLHRHAQPEVVPGRKVHRRKAFDLALHRELDASIRETKERAAQIEQPSQLWDLEHYLTQRRKQIDRQFDFRYSVLPLVFGNLIREGRLSEKELHGLAEDKLRFIRWHASLEPVPTSHR